MENYLTFNETMGDDENASILYHGFFRFNWGRTFDRSETFGEGEVRVPYQSSKKVHIYDDLKGILKKMDLHPDDRDRNREIFEKYIDSLPEIELEKRPADYTWYNTTINGINLRPGTLDGTSSLPDPMVMCGENTHGIVAGTTGSGKSVFLNNLILNLMVEYPPWELELYLADFKKVEMSRYMNKYPAPHVRACAATGEIDYVVSLIRYIKDRMDDRQKLFSRLGITNIEDFRTEYENLVVPRILFLVDEFQQLFLDATNSQKDIIDDLITNITRLGRAQGVHLLFASQDMSGALSQKQLSNFNVRFALLCDPAVSEDILGNTAATRIKRGQVIGRTKTSESLKYTVPFAKDDPSTIEGELEEEYFFRLLNEFVGYADSFHYEYRKTQKFYDEDKQLDIRDLEKLLENPTIKSVRSINSKVTSGSKIQNLMSLVLGRKVVYTNSEYDIENLYMDYSKNRCILCLSGNTADLAYFQKLLALNIRTIQAEASYTIDTENLNFDFPFFFDFNPSVTAYYSELDRIKDMKLRHKDFGNQLVEEQDKEEIDEFISRQFYYRVDDLDYLNEEFEIRKEIRSLICDNQYENALERCEYYIRHWFERLGLRDQKDLDEKIEVLYDAGLGELLENDSNIISFLAGDLSFLGPIQQDIELLLKSYYRYHVLHIRPSYKMFEPIPVWITGIENVERLPNWMSEFIANAMDYNFFVMFFATTDVPYDVKYSSNYIFVSGTNPKLYDDYLNIQMPIGDNGLKFYSWVKNTNKKFAFKKYRCQLNEISTAEIDFDQLLGTAR